MLFSAALNAPIVADASPTLSRRLTLAVVVPLAFLLAVGIVLTAQIIRMNDAAAWVEHSEAVIGKAYEAQKMVLDQETGLRGFLVTKQPDFLEPYRLSSPTRTFEELSKLVADNEAQVQTVAEARSRYEFWFNVNKEVEAGRTETLADVTAMRIRKRQMDAFRDAMSRVIRNEEEYRRARGLSSRTTSQTTLWVALGLFFALAIVMSFVTRTQLRAVAGTYSDALDAERRTRDAVEAQNWIRSQQVSLGSRVQGDIDLVQAGARAIESLTAASGAVVAAFYTRDAGGFRRRASHALDGSSPEFFAHGEGLVGQVAEKGELQHLRNVPAEYLKVRGGIGTSGPVEVLLVPMVLEGVTVAVVEMGFLKPIEDRVLSLVERLQETIAVAVTSIERKLQLRDLLEESQRQGEELQTQQEELRVANEELQQQSDALRGAQAQLEERKEELEASNASLGAQRDALELARKGLAEKASSLAIASRYKSEFLANMSHELRTPLNSTLILARLLADNKKNNLDEEQVKYANTIYSAGNDLLALINDILDLSKIEAGKIDVNPTVSTVGRLMDPIRRIFEPIAKDRGVEFVVDLGDPNRQIDTDVQRAQQVLKNLLSNAFKFTEKGEVRLDIGGTDEKLFFHVKDSGIGIAKDQQEVIFEAFRQADGTTNRRFGGTGLGLSISRDLSRLLGGDLKVESEPGKGSRFTFSLPSHYNAEVTESEAATPLATQAPARPSEPVRSTPRPPRTSATRRFPTDDRGTIDARRRVLLIVEDDAPFAEIVRDAAHSLDYQALVAETADEGIHLATEFLPSAIILDLNLPDHSGLSVLDRLKRDAATRHIPVHIMSAEDYAQAARSMGAVGYTMKPVNRDDLVTAISQIATRFTRLRKLLVVEDDDVQRNAIRALLGNEEVEIVAVGTVKEALEQIRATTFDCVVTDLILSDGTGYDLLEQMANDEAYSFPPVIVYTGRSLTTEEETRLRRYSSSIIVKGARSPERLLDEVTLFLHQVESTLPADQRRMLRQVRDRDSALENRTILIAEDDVRNIFALSSILEPRGAKLVLARNGREAIEMLEKTPRVDLVLMDIMMPEMDGLEAMIAIRKRSERWSRVPIIALTAKAMRDDQERCIKAGANDYVAKPLDVEMLLSLIRVWIRKE